MYSIEENITPELHWIHDPNLQNSIGNTVAMCFAEKGIIPPKEWYQN